MLLALLGLLLIELLDVLIEDDDEDELLDDELLDVLIELLDVLIDDEDNDEDDKSSIDKIDNLS